MRFALVLAFATAFTVSARSQQNRTVDPALYSALDYRSVGPARGGRSTTATGVPGKPFTFYMGSTGGGVWKTTDAGESWQNISDGFIEAGSIGDIRVAASDPNIIYVGTGSGCPRGNVSAGIGVYRSTDGGETWKHVGLREAGQIPEMAIHPANPDVVYVAALGSVFGKNAERGIFRTTDGGTTWKKVLYVSDQTGFNDIAMDPSNPRVLYAAAWTVERKPWSLISGSEEGGIWKSTDGGETWTKLEGGLPTGLVGKIDVTVSPVDPKRLWALIEAPDDKGGVYRSDDGGKSFKHVNDERKLQQRAWYYTHIYADPKDAQTVYALNTSFFKSTDGGRTFEPIPVLHGDCHDLWLNPDNPEILVQTNDGGAHVSLNGGKTWSSLLNQPTAEFYRVFVDNQFPYRLYGPQQDNSTVTVPSIFTHGITPFESWYEVAGGEAGHISFDPNHPGIVYAGSIGNRLDRLDVHSGYARSIKVYPELDIGQRALNLKYRFQWNAPVRVDPHDASVVYMTSNRVHRTRDGGQSWETISPDLTRNDPEKQDFPGVPITNDSTTVEVFDTIFAFEISPFEKGVLWAGSDDGRVHVSRDNGSTWSEVTPRGMPDFATVNAIEFSAHDQRRVFLAVYNYRQDDFKPYVFRTNDNGASWALLTDDKNGIPDGHFVRVVREDPDRKGLLYAGTEYGMYISFDDGAHWQSFQLDLPVTPVSDLRVHRKDLVVATQGRSFWILDDLTPLHQIDDEVKGASAWLYRPRTSYRMQMPGGFGLRYGWQAVAQNPPPGAMIFYTFAKAPEGEVKLEILDGGGNRIRSVSSEGEEAAGPPAFGGPPRGDTKLTKKAGMNRFVWDLSYEGVKPPEGAVTAFAGNPQSGPKAPPGTYQVRLSSGDWSQTETFEVQADPRLPTTASEWQELLDFGLQVRDRIGEIYDAIRKVRSVRDQAKSVAKRLEGGDGAKEVGEAAEALASKLSAIEEKLIQTKNESNQDPLNFAPKLDAQYLTVYGEVSSAFFRPTDAARQRFSDLNQEWTAVEAELKEVLESDVPAFNEKARLAGATAVMVPSR